MNAHQHIQPSDLPARPGAPLVIALHCSGGNGRQWRKLQQLLPEGAALVAPDLIGTATRGHWSGEHAFRLADEAAPIIAMIDRHPGPVHLAGHSYGGGLALHIAAARPGRITGLALYEPSAFHLLDHLGEAGRPGGAEIREVTLGLQGEMMRGAWQDGARRFVDYWGGAGTFSRMKPEHRDDLLRYLPKAPLDFHALLTEPTPLRRYGEIAAPALILRGEHAPTPTRIVADALLALLPDAVQIVVDGAGHMGPITHGDLVAEVIARHFAGIREMIMAEAA